MGVQLSKEERLRRLVVNWRWNAEHYTRAAETWSDKIPEDKPWMRTFYKTVGNMFSYCADELEQVLNKEEAEP